MPRPFYLIKSTGEPERFSINKLKRSLRKADVSSSMINAIIDRIIRDRPSSTHEIHQIVTQMLSRREPVMAARYNIKQALLQLGPTGFPFEHYVAMLFEYKGYSVERGTIISGWCVDHEIDVIATRKNEKICIECKFHNVQSLKSDVKVPLYIKARLDDLNMRSQKNGTQPFSSGWIVSNTKFTSYAITYAQCAGINLLGWGYPEHENLADLIAKHGLHPITALTTLNKRQKRTFIEHGFVLCKDASKYRQLLRELGLSPDKAEKLIRESEELCTIRPEHTT